MKKLFNGNSLSWPTLVLLSFLFTLIIQNPNLKWTNGKMRPKEAFFARFYCCSMKTPQSDNLLVNIWMKTYNMCNTLIPSFQWKYWNTNKLVRSILALPKLRTWCKTITFWDIVDFLGGEVTTHTVIKPLRGVGYRPSSRCWGKVNWQSGKDGIKS